MDSIIASYNNGIKAPKRYKRDNDQAWQNKRGYFIASVYYSLPYQTQREFAHKLASYVNSLLPVVVGEWVDGAYEQYKDVSAVLCDTNIGALRDAAAGIG